MKNQGDKRLVTGDATARRGRSVRAFPPHLSLAPGFSPVMAAKMTRAVSTVSSCSPRYTRLKPGANERSIQADATCHLSPVTCSP